MAWKVRKSEYPKGICTIKNLKNGDLGIQFVEEGDFAGQRYRISKYPDNLNKESLPGRQWRVSVGSDKISLFSIAPLSGVFNVKVEKLASKEGEVPVPNYEEYTWQGEKINYYSFTPILEILDGDCKGMTLPYNLRYYFYEDEDGNVGIDKPKSTYHKPLVEFLTFTGIIKDSMEFSENILPELQKRILKNNKHFKATVKEGYIDSLLPLEEFALPESDEEWDDEEDWDNLDPSETSPKPSSEESVDVDDWD